VSPGSRIPQVLTAGVIAGCSMLLVGCSSPNPSASSVAGTSIAPGQAVPFNAADNARSEITNGRCTPSSGAWVLKGKARNSATKAKTFQIVVDFVTEPGSTVLGSVVVNLPGVGAKATVPWSATGARGKSHVACVVRQAQAR
jgi:hypothetical protein